MCIFCHLMICAFVFYQFTCVHFLPFLYGCIFYQFKYCANMFLHFPNVYFLPFSSMCIFYHLLCWSFAILPFNVLVFLFCLFSLVQFLPSYSVCIIYHLQCHAFAVMSFNSLIFSVLPFAVLCIFNMILMCDFSTIFSSVLLCSGYIYVYIFCHFKGLYFLSSKLFCRSVLAFSHCVLSFIF